MAKAKSTAIDEIPASLRTYLVDQQYLAGELADLLRLLNQDDDCPLAAGVAWRMADALNEALDLGSLIKALKVSKGQEAQS